MDYIYNLRVLRHKSQHPNAVQRDVGELNIYLSSLDVLNHNVRNTCLCRHGFLCVGDGHFCSDVAFVVAFFCAEESQFLVVIYFFTKL